MGYTMTLKVEVLHQEPRQILTAQSMQQQDGLDRGSDLPFDVVALGATISCCACPASIAMSLLHSSSPWAAPHL